MSGKKKKPLVPRLRFPEFRDSGEWEVKRLGNDGITKFSGERVAWNDIPFGHYVSTVNLLPDFAGLSPDPEKPPKGSMIAYHEGDILISNIRPYLRKIWVANKVGGASNDVLVLRPGKGVVHSFLAHLLKSDRFVNYIMASVKGLKMPRGDREQILHFPIPLPQQHEQQKIADCLTSLDELIELQAKRLDAIKAHKKCLLQQLFPRESETTPRLRFPEFRDAGEWEVKRLRELVTTITPPKKIQTTDYQPSGRFPIIDQSTSDICGWTDDNAALVKGKFPVVIFGDHTCIVKLAGAPFAQGADGIKILSPTEEIDGRFLFQSLQVKPIEQKGYKRHFSTLKERLIPFAPKETGEQQKIADCLTSLDELIELQAKRLDALKAHKKGLLQQLFPQEVE